MSLKARWMGNWIAKEVSDRWVAILNQLGAAFGKNTKDCFSSSFVKILSFVGGVVVLSILSTIAAAQTETRSLKLYYVHTNERAEIVFKKNGRYVTSGLKQLNHFLRDWRRNEPTNMDPRLFDLLWQIYKESGSRSYVHVVSAYRAPSTNNMLRLKSANSGVAKDSQHTLGKAIDFYIPDVKLARLRQISLKLEVGGVGYYPKSGSPFIHIDVGNVRHWPRMNRQELMALFPDGKTIHTPSDGVPLAGYQQAMNAHQTRKNKTSPIQLAQKTQKTQKESEKKTLFAALFNKKKKDTPASAGSPTTVAVNLRSNDSNKIQREPISLPDERAPMPMSSPLRTQPNNRLDEDDIRLIAAAMAQDERDENENIEIAQIIDAPPPPIPLSKPASQDSATFDDIAARHEDEVHHTSQLTYLPQLVKQKQTTPPLEAIKTIIAQGDEVEIIPLPDEDLYDASTTISTLIMEQDNQYEKHLDNNSADKDVIRRAIADAIAELEATDPGAVSSVNKDPDGVGSLIDHTKEMTDREKNLTLEGEEIRQIPKMVFISGLQKQEEKSHVTTLTGRAITFPAIARLVHEH